MLINYIKEGRHHIFIQLAKVFIIIIINYTEGISNGSNIKIIESVKCFIELSLH